MYIMDEKINNILFLLEKIDNRLNLIENKLNDISNDTDKMNAHINFINNTYNHVRLPLQYIKNKIDNIIGVSSEKQSFPEVILDFCKNPNVSSNELPQIDNK